MADIFGELNALLGGSTGTSKKADVPLVQQTREPSEVKGTSEPVGESDLDPVPESPQSDTDSSLREEPEQKIIDEVRTLPGMRHVANEARVFERPRESVFWIETVKIKPNPEQPRVTFDETKIRGLAESIRQYGMLQPIVVSKREIDVPTGTQVEYQIIAGERRYRAAQMIGLQHMPAIIRREQSDRIKLELALIENVQREDLHPLERGQAYKRLVKEFGLTVAEVGFRVGKSREAVSNTMRLLMLPEYVQQALVAGTVLEGQVRPLISLAHSPDRQRALFERIIHDGLGAREIENAARDIAIEAGHTVRAVRKEEKAELDAATRVYETRLADALGTRVSVKRTRGGRGKISIEFFSNEEFQNLLARMAAFQQEQSGGGDVPAGNGASSVVIHPPVPAEPRDLSDTIGNAEGSARPEDLNTFTV